MLDWSSVMPLVAELAAQGLDVDETAAHLPAPYNDAGKLYGVAYHQGVRFVNRKVHKPRPPARPYKTAAQKQATRDARNARRQKPGVVWVPWAELRPEIERLAAEGVGVLRASELLGVNRVTLFAKAKRWGVVFARPPQAAHVRAAASERMAAHHQDPAFFARAQARRTAVMGKLWADPEFRARQVAAGAAKAAYMNVGESDAKKRAAAKWIMQQASRALGAEPEFKRLMSEAHARVRLAHPYDAGLEDYMAYLSRITPLISCDPEVRAFATPFMRVAIPEAAARWQARKK